MLVTPSSLAQRAWAKRCVGADGDRLDFVRGQAGDVPVELAGFQRANAGVNAGD